MPKVKCCYTACKFNSGKCVRNERGSFDADDFGQCNFDGEIELIATECEECGCDSDMMDCKTFEFKDSIVKEKAGE
jgi:hypothetical protein